MAKKVLFELESFDLKIARCQQKLNDLQTKFNRLEAEVQYGEELQNKRIRLKQACQDFIEYQNPADYFLPKAFENSDNKVRWYANVDHKLKDDLAGLRNAYEKLKAAFGCNRPSNKSCLTFDRYKYHAELILLDQCLEALPRVLNNPNRAYKQISAVLHTMAKKCSVNQSLEALNHFITEFDNYKLQIHAYQLEKAKVIPEIQTLNAELKVNNLMLHQVRQRMAQYRIRIHANTLKLRDLMQLKQDEECEIRASRSRQVLQDETSSSDWESAFDRELSL